MTDLTEVLAEAARRGVDTQLLVVGTETDRVPRGPSHRWVLIPMSDGSVTVGGLDRGRFAPYGRSSDVETIVGVLGALTRPVPVPGPPRPVEQLRAATEALETRLLSSLESGARPRPHDVPTGAVLDHIGTESGHVLYLFGTPFARRSLPPTDLEEPRTGYVLTDVLPPSSSIEVLPGGFGQPGGGVAVRLDRVIRRGCEDGLLQRFSVVGS